MDSDIVLLVGVVSISGICAVTIAFVLRHISRSRELLSRERIAAIEKGLDLPLERPRRRLPFHPKRLGILLVTLGIGLTVSLIILRGGGRAWGWGVLVVAAGVANLLYWDEGGRKEWEKAAGLEEELMRAYIRRVDARPEPAAGRTPAPEVEAKSDGERG